MHLKCSNISIFYLSTETRSISYIGKLYSLLVAQTNVHESYFLVFGDIDPTFYLFRLVLGGSTTYVLVETFWHDFANYFGKLMAWLKFFGTKLLAIRLCFSVTQETPINWKRNRNINLSKSGSLIVKMMTALKVLLQIKTWEILSSIHSYHIDNCLRLVSLSLLKVGCDLTFAVSPEVNRWTKFRTRDGNECFAFLSLLASLINVGTFSTFSHNMKA